jgi:hypothetical protein
MSSTVSPWYFMAFAGIYHTDEHCPIGRTIPAELRANGAYSGQTWCLACRARDEARLRRAIRSAMPPSS